MHLFLLTLLLRLSLLGGLTPTPTSSGTPSPTFSMSLSKASTKSPTATPTPSRTLTPTRTFTSTPSHTASQTSSVSTGSSPSQTPSFSPTPSITPSFSTTPTETATPTSSSSLTSTSSRTPSGTPSPSLSTSGTRTPSFTPTPTPSNCVAGQGAEVGGCIDCQAGSVSMFPGDICRPCNFYVAAPVVPSLPYSSWTSPSIPYANAYSDAPNSRNCKWCAKYFYSNKWGNSCLPCPGGVWWSNSTDDFGNNKPTSPGPWGLIPSCLDPQMVCENPELCLGNGLGCAVGYTGYHCSLCDINFFKAYSGDCKRCPVTFYPTLGIVLFLFLCLAVFVIWFMTVTDPKRRDALLSELKGLITPTLLLDHFTRLLLLHRLGSVPYPEIFRDTVGTTSFLGFDFDSSGPSCLVSGGLGFDYKWLIVMGGMGGIQALALLGDIGMVTTQSVKAAMISRRERKAYVWNLGKISSPVSPQQSASIEGEGGRSPSPRDSSERTPAARERRGPGQRQKQKAGESMKSDTLVTSQTALTFVLPMGAQMCFMALTSTTLPNGTMVVYWDTTVLFFGSPHVVVAAFSFGLLFLYAIWCLSSVGRFLYFHFNRNPDKEKGQVERNSSAWIAATRCFGFLRAGTTMLSPKPLSAMAYLVGLGIVELALAWFLFDKVARIMEKSAKDALKRSAKVFPESRTRLKASILSAKGLANGEAEESDNEIWGCSCGSFCKRLGLKGVRGQLALFLAVSITTQATGLYYSNTGINETTTLSAHVWGSVVVTLNVLIFLVFIVPLLRKFTPRLFQLCPRSGETLSPTTGEPFTSRRLFNVNGEESAIEGPIHIVDNPLHGVQPPTFYPPPIIGSTPLVECKRGFSDEKNSGVFKEEDCQGVGVTKSEEMDISSKWLQLECSEGVYFECVETGETAWELPCDAVIVTQTTGEMEWFSCTNDEGETWYEQVISGHTSWDLPPKALLVPNPYQKL